MPGLEPGIHVFAPDTKKDVDGRDTPAMTKTIHFSDERIERSLRLPPDLLGAVLARGSPLALARLRQPSLAEEWVQRLARAGADVVIEERQHQLETDQEGQRGDHDGAGRHQLI